MNGVQNLTEQKKYKLKCDTFKVYGLFYLTIGISGYIVNNELDRVWKVAAVEHDMVLFQHYPGEAEENCKTSQLRRYSRNSYRSPLEQTKRILLLEQIFEILKLICHKIN